MILNNASYAIHNGDEIALMKLDGVIIFKNPRYRSAEYTVDTSQTVPLNYSDGNGLPLFYRSTEDYSTDYYEQIEIFLNDGTITTDVTTKCNNILKVRVWWTSFEKGISFAHGTTKLVKSLDYIYTSPSLENYYPFFEHWTSTTYSSDLIITSLNVSNWKVKNLDSLFNHLESLTTLTGINQWDTSEVLTMSYTFFSCESLTTLNLSDWNTANVVDMSHMFKLCSSLTSLNLSSWDTRKVKDMSSMFYNCSKLTSLDLSGWHTDSLERTWNMFEGCEALEYLDIRNFVLSDISSDLSMFYDCHALKEIRLDNCNNYTIKQIISASAALPKHDSTIGKLYVRRENVANLEAPSGWQFEYID